MWKKLLEKLRWLCLNHGDKIEAAVIGLGLGIGISGAITAGKNSKRIDELNGYVCDLDTRQDGYEEQVEQQFTELRRQNNLLLEKALRETEGTAE